MRTTLSIVAVLVSVGSLDTVTSQSERACFTWLEKVAFTTARDNPNWVPIQDAAEIYLMNPDGSDPQRITENEVGDAFPVLAPDGKKFVFDSNRLRLATESVNTSDLFVMASNGTEQTHLLRGSSASWSPDGKSITFHASRSGTGQPIRVDPGAPPIDSDLFILNVDDFLGGLEPAINITESDTLIEDDPHWSPDGQKIVYTAHLVNDDPIVSVTAEVFMKNADGSGVPVALTSNTAEERAPAWSPDGTRIVFMCRYGGMDFEVCVINADGSGLLQVTNNSIQELSIRWSNDGTKFFFNRPVAGRNQLFSMNVDGTGTTQLTNSEGPSLFPAPGWVRVKTDCKDISRR